MENLFGIFLSAKEAKLDQFQEKEKENDQIKEVKEEIMKRQRNIRKKENGIKKETGERKEWENEERKRKGRIMTDRDFIERRKKEE